MHFVRVNRHPSKPMRAVQCNVVFLCTYVDVCEQFFSMISLYFPFMTKNNVCRYSCTSSLVFIDSSICFLSLSFNLSGLSVFRFCKTTYDEEQQQQHLLVVASLANQFFPPSICVSVVQWRRRFSLSLSLSFLPLRPRNKPKEQHIIYIYAIYLLLLFSLIYPFYFSLSLSLLWRPFSFFYPTFGFFFRFRK